MMRINADFSRSATVVIADNEWISSPQPGVDRIMLDRVGDEVARATSVVKYAAGSSFNRHEHAKGEEFLVLEGVFSDEHADYPAGTYVRNPPGSGHSPFSRDGCRILVKLRQFDAQDLAHVVVDTKDARGWHKSPTGEMVLLLHRFGAENVQMIRLETNDQFELSGTGDECFIVSGSLVLDDVVFSSESWLRFPVGVEASVRASEPAVVWHKYGHLPASEI